MMQAGYWGLANWGMWGFSYDYAASEYVVPAQPFNPFELF
jgi:hypothetical protein